MRPLLRGDSRVRHTFVTVAVTVEGKGILKPKRASETFGNDAVAFS